jgi:hypothetical protein
VIYRDPPIKNAPEPARNPDARVAHTRQRILDLLGGRATAIFVREPFIDPRCPDTSDADVLAFGTVDSLLPERLNLPAAAGTLPIDVIWLPQALLADPARLAAEGLLPHRLATSTLLLDRDGTAAAAYADVRTAMEQPPARAARIGGFMQMGFLAVREIGVTWDFPPLALFWLHTAFAAATAAWCDASGRLCPNVYTRPFDSLRRIPEAARENWDTRIVTALRLDTDPESLIPLLRTLHEIVAGRFPEPQWPGEMRGTTRAEYVYFLDRAELEWRIAVAQEMIRRGDTAQAVYYLRFWAYSLARMPMVHQCARQGRDVSFMRPERAMGPALRELCAELVEPLALILAAATTADDVRAGLEVLSALRARALDVSAGQGLALGALPAWIPFEKDRGR